MNIITVKINGMEYNLRGEENDEYLQMIGKYVDNKINSLMNKNSKISRADATILAAINLGDEVFKSREAYERCNENNKMLNDDQKKLISELEGMRRDLEAIKNENDKLKETISMKAIDEKAIEKSKNAAKQVQELTDEIIYLKEELALMEETIDELKKNKTKVQTINKKLLSENNKLRYQHMARVRKIEELSEELEKKNVILLKGNKSK